MSDLKRCPCGAQPSEVGVVGNAPAKWMYVSADCCGIWEVEFRSHYKTGDKLRELAIDAWNRAPRA